MGQRVCYNKHTDACGGAGVYSSWSMYIMGRRFEITPQL
jgi:hypothetical protein